MKISALGREFRLELRAAAQSTLANPEQWLIDVLGGGRTDAGVIVNEQTALRMSAVWACVDILSKSIARLPCMLYQRQADGSKTRATDHRLYSILHDQPNAEMTSYTFWKVMMVSLLLGGNSYAEIERDKVGRVVGLTPIPLDQFQVHPERYQGVIRYRVTGGMGNVDVYLPAESVLHLLGLSRSGLLGLSPISAARQGIGLGLAAEQYGSEFFKNGANLGGVLEHPGKLSAEGAEMLRKSWLERHSGTKNAHGTAVLEQGMKYTPIGIPPKDANFIESRKFQITDIARIFGVPPHMIGDLDRATWGNIEQQSIDFVVNSLGPWLANIEQTISWKLLDPRERQSYYAEFLVDALLRGDVTARNTSYTAGRNGGWLSANDIRRRENMDPIEGGDVYLVPLNMVPADQAGTKQASNAGRRAGDGQGA